MKSSDDGIDADKLQAQTCALVFEQAFKNIDDVLRKEAGCTTELDYTEQTSWLLFLKYSSMSESTGGRVSKLALP